MNNRRFAEAKERGAVSTIVAILFFTMVIFAVGALVLDMGTIKWERRQLQNGADAAAMALAKACAQGAATCRQDNPVVQSFLNSNAKDGTSSKDSVCGRFKAGFTPANIPTVCASATTDADIKNLVECPALPSWMKSATGSKVPYVEVKAGTSTNAANTSTLLPGIFSRALTGNDNPHGSACARAAWGPPGSGTATIPLTFSACEWYIATNKGTSYPNVETALIINDTNHYEDCKNWQGHDFPGGFGWLTATTNCQAHIDTEGWVSVSTGVGGYPSGCAPTIKNFVGKVVQIPIFDCVSNEKEMCTNTSNGSGGNYHVMTMAAFYVTAIDTTGAVSNNLPGYPTAAGKAKCDPSKPTNPTNKCLYGWFLKDYVGGGDTIDPDAPDFGFTNVVPVG